MEYTIKVIDDLNIDVIDANGIAHPVTIGEGHSIEVNPTVEPKLTLTDKLTDAILKKYESYQDNKLSIYDLYLKRNGLTRNALAGLVHVSPSKFQHASKADDIEHISMGIAKLTAQGLNKNIGTVVNDLDEMFKLQLESKMSNFDLNSVKQATEEFNSWQGKAIIYLFPDSAEVETYIYNSDNDWTRFNDDVNPIVVAKKDDLYGRNDTISYEQLLNRLERAVKQDFDDYDDNGRGYFVFGPND